MQIALYYIYKVSFMLFVKMASYTMNNMATGDEQWVYYDNPHKRKLWDPSVFNFDMESEYA